jgi:hypothetical protein
LTTIVILLHLANNIDGFYWDSKGILGDCQFCMRLDSIRIDFHTKSNEIENLRYLLWIYHKRVDIHSFFKLNDTVVLSKQYSAIIIGIHHTKVKHAYLGIQAICQKSIATGVLCCIDAMWYFWPIESFKNLFFNQYENESDDSF